jgi:hypothetical protein
MKKQTTHKAIRLALRSEGEFWTASVATMDSMEGAVEIGRIRLKLAQDETLREKFKNLMTEAFKASLAEIGLTPTSMSEHPAPDHERGGNA